MLRRRKQGQDHCPNIVAQYIYDGSARFLGNWFLKKKHMHNVKKWSSNSEEGEFPPLLIIHH